LGQHLLPKFSVSIERGTAPLEAPAWHADLVYEQADGGPGYDESPYKARGRNRVSQDRAQTWVGFGRFD
jgi:hypothetical protein